MSTCGCEIEEAFYGNGVPRPAIRFCKLHQAAEETLEMLKSMMKRFEDYAHEKPHSWCGCTYCNATCLIDRVEGKG